MMSVLLQNHMSPIVNGTESIIIISQSYPQTLNFRKSNDLSNRLIFAMIVLNYTGTVVHNENLL